MTRRVTSLPVPDREAIRSSAEFRAFVEEQSLEAQRRRDDRQAEIESKRTEISRSLSDHESFAVQAEIEIAKLEEKIEDDNQIIEAAELMLSGPRQAPALTAHETPVVSALEEQ